MGIIIAEESEKEEENDGKTIFQIWSHGGFENSKCPDGETQLFGKEAECGSFETRN